MKIAKILLVIIAFVLFNVGVYRLLKLIFGSSLAAFALVNLAYYYGIRNIVISLCFPGCSYFYKRQVEMQYM